jgi:multidrug efflux pump subunit AcrA (membrane-fusion protein)
LIVAFALGSVSSADDSWMAWKTPTDGQSDGIDVSFRPTTTTSCTQKRFVAIFPRFKNRYTERVAGTLEIVHESPQGSRTASTSFDLAPSETKAVETGAVCHETNRQLKLAIVQMRFPDREAEQRKLAEQKAAAEKAAAEQAAQQRAAAQKYATEVAAAEEARKQRVEERRTQAEQDDARRRDEATRRQREVAAAEAAERERARIAAIEAQHRSEDKASLADLRRGEINFELPIGFQQVELASARAGGLVAGGRVEARVFAWLSASGTRAAPAGNGFELAIAGGAATVTELQSQSTGGQLTTANASARARFWRGTFALGVFGDWTRYSYTPEGAPNEKHTLFAIGPEAALGLIAGRKVGIELGIRLGAVASTFGEFSGGVTSDLYMAAYVAVAINYIYAGAIATRYQDVSSGAVSSSWNAVGIVGARAPF